MMVFYEYVVKVGLVSQERSKRTVFEGLFLAVFGEVWFRLVFVVGFSVIFQETSRMLSGFLVQVSRKYGRRRGLDDFGYRFGFSGVLEGFFRVRSRFFVFVLIIGFRVVRCVGRCWLVFIAGQLRGLGGKLVGIVVSGRIVVGLGFCRFLSFRTVILLLVCFAQQFFVGDKFRLGFGGI